MNLNGNWRGYYEYGVGYKYPIFGTRIDFALELKDNDCNITGTSSEEDAPLSVPFPGAIRGYYEDTFVSFVKTYPVNPELSEDLKSIVIHEGELEVEHEGFLDNESKAMYGLWRIHVTCIHPETNEQIPGVCEGTWLLKKEE